MELTPEDKDFLKIFRRINKKLTKKLFIYELRKLGWEEEKIDEALTMFSEPLPFSESVSPNELSPVVLPVKEEEEETEQKPPKLVVIKHRLLIFKSVLGKAIYLFGVLIIFAVIVVEILAYKYEPPRVGFVSYTAKKVIDAVEKQQDVIPNGLVHDASTNNPKNFIEFITFPNPYLYE